MIHPTPHPLAGQSVRIKPRLEHLAYSPPTQFGGAPFQVRDYFDRVKGKSWQECDGNLLCLLYAIHVGDAGLPCDDEVLLGKIGNAQLMVHVSEVEVPAQSEGGAPRA